MRNIESEIIADSINTVTGKRITTFKLRYPRFIHSELMTHRMFSRNAASSRAIPVEKMVAAVRINTARPEYWGLAKKGMQAGAEVNNKSEALHHWNRSATDAATYASVLSDFGLHKQIVNRVLEPFSHITVLVTATDYENFFKLRAHKDAQPEFQVLAFRMLEQYLNGTPEEKGLGEWHIPYDEPGLDLSERLSTATARAARISYDNLDGSQSTPKGDKALHGKLAASGHWSPFEHCAQASINCDSNNFRGGWLQYREQIELEPEKDPNMLTNLLENKPEWVNL